MVVRTRFRAFFRQLALFLGAAVAIGYFGFHAFSGDHGIQAQHQFDAQKQELTAQLATLEAERAALERRVGLMKAAALDPDELEEKSRQMLGLVHPDDVVFILPARIAAPTR
jgi:cell division protein FtsB